MYLTAGKCPETSLEGPEKEDILTELGQVRNAIFSTTIIQTAPARLSYRLFISAGLYFTFVSALLILFPSLVEQVSRLISLQLANGSWSTSVVSARLEMTSVHVLSFISLSIKGELLIGPPPYRSVGFYSMLNS